MAADQRQEVGADVILPDELEAQKKMSFEDFLKAAHAHQHRFWDAAIEDLPRLDDVLQMEDKMLTGKPLKKGFAWPAKVHQASCR